jgi:hypothetical protein
MKVADKTLTGLAIETEILDSRSTSIPRVLILQGWRFARTIT